jgi:hypothetical protein
MPTGQRLQRSRLALDHPTDLDLPGLDLYRARGIDPRVILGLDLRHDLATDGPPNAERARGDGLGGGQVTGFYRAFTGLRPFGGVWDEVTTDPSARLRWFDPEAGTWWQTYVDTPATFRPKLLLALREGLAGVGLWALGYEGSLAGYGCGGRVLAVVTAAVTPVVGASLDVTVSAETLDVLAPTRWVQLSNDGVTWSPPMAPDAVTSMVITVNSSRRISRGTRKCFWRCASIRASVHASRSLRSSSRHVAK